jgi:hypothetical protein
VTRRAARWANPKTARRALAGAPVTAIDAESRADAEKKTARVVGRTPHRCHFKCGRPMIGLLALVRGTDKIAHLNCRDANAAVK